MQVWDLGGQTKLRPYWVTYMAGADAVMVVVDSTDRARMPVVKVRGQQQERRAGGWRRGHVQRGQSYEYMKTLLKTFF